jgi:signal transduction histidine kinase
MRQLANVGIRTRALALVFASFVPALIFIVIAVYAQLALRKQLALQDARKLTDQIAVQYRQMLGHSEQILRSLSLSGELQSEESATCTSYLSRALGVFPAFLNVGVVDLHGKVVCSTAPMVATDETFRTQIARAVENGGRLSAGEFELSESSGKESVVLYLPVIAEDRNVRYVLYASLDLHWLQGYIEPPSIPLHSKLMIFDRSGRLLASWPKNSDPIGTPAQDLALPAAIMQENLSAQGMYEDRSHGMLFGLSRLTNGGDSSILVTLGVPTSVMYADARQNLIFYLSALTAILAAAFGAAWFTSRFMIIRPLRDLVKATRQIASGNLEARVDASKGAAELRELGSAFNQMAASLQDSLIERSEAQGSLALRASELIKSQKELEEINFLASHHLYEPLMRVWGALEMMIRMIKSRIDSSFLRYLEDCLKGVRRIHTIITDLVVYSNEELGLVPIEFDEILTRAKADLAEKIKNSGAVISNDPLPTMTVNPELMIQLLNHLLDNALTHRSLQSPKIHISATEDEKEWTIAVHDNGIGIDPKHHQEIFEIHRREHTDASFLGAGIGLAVSRKIVERHNGKIWVESNFGKGSTFLFSIPKKPGMELRRSDKFARKRQECEKEIIRIASGF